MNLEDIFNNFQQNSQIDVQHKRKRLEYVARCRRKKILIQDQHSIFSIKSIDLPPKWEFSGGSVFLEGGGHIFFTGGGPPF